MWGRWVRRYRLDVRLKAARWATRWAARWATRWATDRQQDGVHSLNWTPSVLFFHMNTSSNGVNSMSSLTSSLHPSNPSLSLFCPSSGGAQCTISVQGSVSPQRTAQKSIFGDDYDDYDDQDYDAPSNHQSHSKLNPLPTTPRGQPLGAVRFM